LFSQPPTFIQYSRLVYRCSSVKQRYKQLACVANGEKRDSEGVRTKLDKAARLLPSKGKELSSPRGKICLRGRQPEATAPLLFEELFTEFD
ncbi:hypothetical protein PoB_001896400, partial [Plakobranchus ocellatus]